MELLWAESIEFVSAEIICLGILYKYLAFPRCSQVYPCPLEAFFMILTLAVQTFTPVTERFKSWHL